MSGERLERHQAVEPRGAPIHGLRLPDPLADWRGRSLHKPEESYAGSSSSPNLSSAQSSA